MNHDFLARVSRSLSGACLVIAAVISPSAACQSQLMGSDSTAVLELVTSQLIVDRLAVGLPVPERLGPEQFSLEPFDSVGPIRVYRVTARVLEHWHPYLVAVSAGAVHPLGGFPAPEVLSTASLVDLSPRSLPEASRMAGTWATLLDPYGSGDVAFARDSLASNELKVAWRRAARSGLPRDTTIQTPSGGRQVRITVLSHRSRQYPAAWQPVSFVFEFDSYGRVVVWTMRLGESSYALEGPS